ERRFGRACEILGFRLHDGASDQADCWQSQAEVKAELHDYAGALALMDRVLPQLRTMRGDDHPETATAYAARGKIRAALGRHASAIADLEKALAVLAKSTLDPGHLATVELDLAMELAKRDPARARSLIASANAHLDHASKRWAKTRRDIAAWLASRDGKAIAK